MAVDFDNVMKEFISESNELLDRAEANALHLEEGFDEAVVNDIFRAMHTIKGNSGLFDLEPITELAHSMENVLNGIRNKEIEPNLPAIDLILTCIDRLRGMIANMSDLSGFDNTQLLLGLNEILKTSVNSSIAKKAEDIQIKPVQKIENSNKQEAAKKSSSPLKKGGFRIPGKFIRHAQEKGQFLTLVYMNLLDQENSTIALLAERISKIEKSKLLMYGPRIDYVEDGIENFPYFLILVSEIPGEELLAKHNLRGKTRMLYDPIHHNGSAASAVKETSKNETIKKTPAVEMKAPPAAPSVPRATVQNEPSKMMQGGDTHLRVPIELIDGLINLAGETVIARNELSQRITRQSDPGLDMIGKRMSQLITRIQEGIMRTRLQELNSVFQRLPRIVRDTAHVTGKEVNLIVEGGDVELDKSMIDGLGDSLMHMVRNAIDHGIESPDVRRSLGKKEVGTLRVSAYLRGGNVVMMIRDDGAGLPLDKIKEKAISKGLITREESLHMPPEQIMDIVFRPGFSTADQVTGTSGRGVGMDVVRSNFKKMGGNVEITSEAGKGTTIISNIPQTLSIVTCLLLRSCDSVFALPQQNLVELILIDPERIKEVEKHRVYELRNHLLPLVDLGKTLKLEGSESHEGQFIAVVKSERHHFGVLIDEVINLEEIVVKRLGVHFANLTFFSGAAIMGDGEAVIILDVPGIARFVNMQANALEDLHEVKSEKEEDEGYLIFVATGQRFAVPVSTIPRIEKVNQADLENFMGREVVKYREEVVPVVRLEEVYDFKNSQRSEGDFYMIIFTIDGVRSGIVADEVFNVVKDMPNLDKKKFVGHSVLGHSIINGETTLIIDAVNLLKNLQDANFININKLKIRKVEAEAETVHA